MISYIQGNVLKTDLGKDTYVDILTKMGLGYRVYIPSRYMLPVVGDEYSLYIHFHVREDSQIMYGFEKEEERDIFESLISVSGIGPKIALSVMSTYSNGELESILNEGDAKELSKVSGLGLKGAQKIILELRGKVDFVSDDNSGTAVIKELRDALKSLGFTGNTLKEKLVLAEDILKKNDNIEIEVLIKEVLNT